MAEMTNKSSGHFQMKPYEAALYGEYAEMTNKSSGHFQGGRGKPVYPGHPGRLPASRERSGRQAFPPVIALRLSVAQNP